MLSDQQIKTQKARRIEAQRDRVELLEEILNEERLALDKTSGWMVFPCAPFGFQQIRKMRISEPETEI